MKRISVITLLLSCSLNTFAATEFTEWTIFSDPSPAGVFMDRIPGADFRFGTADDIAVAGRNGNGHSFYSEFAPDFYSVNGGTISGAMDLSTFEYMFTEGTFPGTFNCPAVFCGAEIINENNEGVLVSLDDSSNGGALDLNPEQTFSAALDFASPDGNIFRNSGSGLFLVNGQDPGLLPGIDAASATHLQAVIASNVLPADWTRILLIDLTATIIEGPNLGVNNRSTITAFSTVTSTTVVPVPPALVLLGSAMVWMVGGRRRRTAS